jgi:hypothetical protein
MSTYQHIYMYVDPLWSYNFVGAVEEFGTLENVEITTLYNHAAQYVQLRHNFITNAERGQNNPTDYNNGLATLRKKTGYFDVPHGTFEFYWELLYRSMRVCLCKVRATIISIQTVMNDKHEIQGVVAQVQLH